MLVCRLIQNSVACVVSIDGASFLSSYLHIYNWGITCRHKSCFFFISES